MRRGIAARNAGFFQRQAVHHGAARHNKAFAQVAAAAVGLNFSDRHRRRRRQIIWRNHLQQTLGEARKLRVHFHLHAGGQEGETFHQALNVRVRHFDAAHAEPPRHFRVALGELCAHLAQIGQFTVVIFEQFAFHNYPASFSSKWPFSRSTSVRKRNSSGYGTHHRRPLISIDRTLCRSNEEVSDTQRT